MHRDLTLPSIVLGLMGIAPQLAMLAVFEVSPDTSATVKQLSALYATIILSFLGGLWWMSALLARRQTWGPSVLAVLPSLIGWGLLAFLTMHWISWRVVIGLLGGLLLASPIIDTKFVVEERAPNGWLRLRWLMATGLGMTTLGFCLL
jgi:hypothetical protein